MVAQKPLVAARSRRAGRCTPMGHRTPRTTADDEVLDLSGEVQITARIGDPAAVYVLLDKVRSLGVTLDYLCVDV